MPNRLLDDDCTLLSGSIAVNGGVGQEAEVLNGRAESVEVQASHLLELNIGGGASSGQNGSLLHSHSDFVAGSQVVPDEEIELGLGSGDAGGLADSGGPESGGIGSVAEILGGPSLSICGGNGRLGEFDIFCKISC